MSNFKMVENRKYNDEEIRFVTSRVHAGWDPTIIAKAFKKHFGEYWANREFTKKQVAYIRTTYKPPPGLVKPYTGPIPVFTPSPTPEESPLPTSSAGHKRKQAAGPTQTRSSSNQTPMYQTPVNQTPMRQTPMHEQPGSPIAGPSRKRQRTQGGSGEGQDPDLLSASNLLRGTNDVGGETAQPKLPNLNNIAGNDFDVYEEDPALRDGSLEPNSPGMLLPGAGANADDRPALPNYLDLHPNVPVQSIERHRSIAPGGGAGTNATNSGFPTPNQQQQQQQHSGQQPGQPPNPHMQDLYPPTYSHRGAVARDDPYGVWYFNPHDTCQIWMGHRHDFDGGVWFTSDTSVHMSLTAMRHTEGVGFMLGVAAAAQQILNLEGGRYFEGRGVDPQDLMRQAALVVRDHVPAEVLDGGGGEGGGFRVPDPADVARLDEVNRRLPAGSFYDPFHRRVVEYDMSGRVGTGGGVEHQGDGAPGPSRQRDGQQGDGGVGSSRPSRQGTVAPARVHRSQRTNTPRNGGPSRQGTNAP